MKKVVIKVCMNDDTTGFYCFGPRSSHFKAMRVTTGIAGVQSMAPVGDDKDQIEVVGERVDAVELTTLLRKNVGFAETVTMGEADAKTKTRRHSPSSGRTSAGSCTVKSSTSRIHTQVIANPRARSGMIDKD